METENVKRNNRKEKVNKKENIIKYWIQKFNKTWFVLVFKNVIIANQSLTCYGYVAYFKRTLNHDLTLMQENKSFMNPIQNVLSSQRTELKTRVIVCLIPCSFHYVNNVISQHSFRIDLNGLLIHTPKDCTLDVHSAGSFTTLVWPINIAAPTLSVKWALNASITINDLWKPISFVLSCKYLSFSYHNIIKCSSKSFPGWQ